MGQRCGVCANPHRREIDEAIVGGAAQRAIARQWGLSKDSVRRHARDHLPVHLVEAEQAADVAHAGRLLDRLERLIARAETILDRAEAGGDDRTSLAALKELRHSLALLGRVSGEITAAGPMVSVNVAVGGAVEVPQAIADVSTFTSILSELAAAQGLREDAVEGELVELGATTGVDG